MIGSDFWNLSFCWWKVFAALKRVLLYFAFSKHLKQSQGKHNWNSLLPCLVQVYYCYSGACKGDILCGPVFLFFLYKGFIRKSAVWYMIGSDFWNLSFCWWKVFAALKRVLLYFAFSKHLKTYAMPSWQSQNMSFLAVLKVNGANFSIGEKNGVGKKVSTIAMLGPLLAMPSGQGLNMTLLAILKVNGANWLLVLEIKLELRKKVSTIDKISLLVRQH